MFPTPSYPKLFPPNEKTCPFLSNIIVWEIPQVTYLISVPSKAIGANKGSYYSFFALPNYPTSPAPQVKTLVDLSNESIAIIAECRLPTAI